MAAFELLFAPTPLEIPDLVLSLDARNAPSGDCVLASTTIKRVVNRAPPSYRIRRRGDYSRAPWWDGVPATGLEPTQDPSAFGGRGGAVFPSAPRPLLYNADGAFLSGLPGKATPGGFTVAAALDWTAVVESYLYRNEDGIGLVLSDGGNLAWSDASTGSPSTPISTGIAATSGQQRHLVRFGADGVANRVDWWRDGSSVYAANGVYTPSAMSAPPKFTGFGGNEDGDYIPGTIGAGYVYTRAVSSFEADMIDTTIARRFGLPYTRRYTFPEYDVWNDPAGAGKIPRTNTIPGLPALYRKFVKDSILPLSFLVVAVLPDGTIDTSTDFVPWFVEWPFQGSAMEPPIYQDPVAKGVFRLDILAVGHYLFELYRPGGGAVLVHFDVVAA